ncbi:MAG: hypothetical protein K0R54_4050 [Clostridiaceae bacterium]|jgi:hypothetical protein|nr:hypothetical protein [Clostridiaceae bacterium]
MSEITLEKIDIIRERTNVSYSEAKEALEMSEGNVVDALIFIENNKKSTMDNLYTTKDEFNAWIKDLVNKGNVNRIKIKKDDKIIADIPVNAGIAATLTALIWPPLIAIGLLTAVFTKVTVEISKTDGSVEVVNKIIKTTVDDVKDKVYDAASTVKDKFKKRETEDENTAYKYTVKFDEMDDQDKK